MLKAAVIEGLHPLRAVHGRESDLGQRDPAGDKRKTGDDSGSRIEQSRYRHGKREKRWQGSSPKGRFSAWHPHRATSKCMMGIRGLIKQRSPFRG